MRLKAVPPNVRDDAQLHTRALFEKCVGKSFVVEGIDSVEGLVSRLVRLDVGHIVGEAPYMHTIWVEEEFLEPDNAVGDPV